MKWWQAQARLIYLAALCMAGGIVTQFLPEQERTRVLSAGLFLGGVAMLIVALSDGDPDKHRKEDDDDD